LALQIRDLLLAIGDLLFRFSDLLPKPLVLFSELLVLSLQLLPVEWALLGTQPWPLQRPSSAQLPESLPRTHPASGLLIWRIEV
jgi:hypothetical protein